VDDLHPIHRTGQPPWWHWGRRWTTQFRASSSWPAEMGDTPQSTTPIATTTKF